MDFACISICFIWNKCCTILESVDPFDHLSEARVVHGRQSEMMTCLTTGNTGGHDGIDGMNEVPLVFECERLLAQRLIDFSGDNNSLFGGTFAFF